MNDRAVNGQDAGYTGTGDQCTSDQVTISQNFALATDVVELATKHRLKLAVAESLTGGLLAATIVSVPGASVIFAGGIVAYDLAVKSNLLGVSTELLERSGAVAEEVALQMASGARAACSVRDELGSLQEADLAVSTTGVAGPDPDATTGQEPGTVWIGLSFKSKSKFPGVADDYAKLLPKLTGTRDEIRIEAVKSALETLKLKLESL